MAVWPRTMSAIAKRYNEGAGQIHIRISPVSGGEGLLEKIDKYWIILLKLTCLIILTQSNIQHSWLLNICS